MQIETKLSFKAGTFSGGSFLDLIKLYVDFEIKKFSVDEIRDSEMNYNEKYFSKIEKCTDEAELIFRTDYKNGKPNEQFWIMESAVPKSPQTLYWFLNDRYLSDDNLLALTSSENFTTGYISDADFLQWQNEKSIKNYEYYGKEHKHLPRIFDKDFNQWEIDIKKINPGRSAVVANMWLQSAFIMLFGRHFIELVGKEKLLKFEHAYEIKELPNGVIWIQLYKDLRESASPEVLQVLKQFREWIELDKYEDMLRRAANRRWC